MVSALPVIPSIEWNQKLQLLEIQKKADSQLQAAPRYEQLPLNQKPNKTMGDIAGLLTFTKKHFNSAMKTVRCACRLFEKIYQYSREQLEICNREISLASEHLNLVSNDLQKHRGLHRRTQSSLKTIETLETLSKCQQEAIQDCLLSMGSVPAEDGKT